MKIYVAAAGDQYYPMSRLQDIQAIKRTPQESKDHLLTIKGSYDWVEVVEIDTEALTWTPFWIGVEGRGP